MNANAVSLIFLLAVGCTHAPPPAKMMEEIHRHLHVGRMEDAVNVLSEMIGAHPDSSLTVRAFTWVWSRMDGTDARPDLLRTYRAQWLASAPGVYQSLLQSRKLIDNRGMLDPVAAAAQPDSLQVYVEQGFVLRELGRDGRTFQLDGAASVFSNAIRVARPESELWWVCKYEVLATLFDRGSENDLKL